MFFDFLAFDTLSCSVQIPIASATYSRTIFADLFPIFGVYKDTSPFLLEARSTGRYLAFPHIQLSLGVAVFWGNKTFGFRRLVLAFPFTLFAPGARRSHCISVADILVAETEIASAVVW